MNDELINQTLWLAVEMEYQRYKRSPYLLELSASKLTEWADIIAGEADTIMFKTPGKTGINFVVLARAIAYLAIISPSGVDFNGRNYNLSL